MSLYFDHRSHLDTNVAFEEDENLVGVPSPGNTSSSSGPLSPEAAVASHCRQTDCTTCYEHLLNRDHRLRYSPNCDGIPPNVVHRVPIDYDLNNSPSSAPFNNESSRQKFLSGNCDPYYKPYEEGLKKDPLSDQLDLSRVHYDFIAFQEPQFTASQQPSYHSLDEHKSPSASDVVEGKCHQFDGTSMKHGFGEQITGDAIPASPPFQGESSLEYSSPKSLTIDTSPPSSPFVGNGQTTCHPVNSSTPPTTQQHFPTRYQQGAPASGVVAPRGINFGHGSNHPRRTMDASPLPYPYPMMNGYMGHAPTYLQQPRQFCNSTYNHTMVPKSHHYEAEDEDEGGNAVLCSDTLCGVCKAPASGRHYSGITCEGCKGFFRRIVIHDTVYDCKSGTNKGQCPIHEYNRRKCCKACRFQRCLSIGMDPKMCLKRKAPSDDEDETRNVDSNISSNQPATGAGPGQLVTNFNFQMSSNTFNNPGFPLRLQRPMAPQPKLSFKVPRSGQQENGDN